VPFGTVVAGQIHTLHRALHRGRLYVPRKGNKKRIGFTITSDFIPTYWKNRVIGKTRQDEAIGKHTQEAEARRTSK
jgi:hypothetical protein